MIAGRLRRDGYLSAAGLRGSGITSCWSRFDGVMLVEQTPVGRGYRSGLIAGRLRRDGYLSAAGLRGSGITSCWSRFDGVMLVEQTPVGRGYRSVERLA